MNDEDLVRRIQGLLYTEFSEEEMLRFKVYLEQKARADQENNVLDLLRLKCICRIRGLETDISCGYPMQGRLDEYQELLRHLEKLKWIIADIECAKKYLDEKELAQFKKLKEALAQGERQT